MPYQARKRDELSLDTSGTVLEVSDRLFDQYLALTEQLFDALHALAPAGRDFGIVSRRYLDRKAAPPSERPADTLRKIVALDAEMPAFLRRLEAHQQTEQQIEDVQMQLIDRQASAMELQRVMEEKHFEADQLLHEATKLIDRATQARKGAVACMLAPLDVAEVVAYATRLAKFTTDSYAPERVHEPPIPQEQHMRASLLFQEGHGIGALANLDEEDQEDEPTDVVPQFTFSTDVLSISQDQESTAHGEEELDLDLDF
ncbi:hypothetical protein HKX48_007097 [Thoreauomyces humboldtii]|nr:hypothetical protein HKX48_007097 [Thoreauomyces humboldtii]